MLNLDFYSPPRTQFDNVAFFHTETLGTLFDIDNTTTQLSPIVESKEEE